MRHASTLFLIPSRLQTSITDYNTPAHFLEECSLDIEKIASMKIEPIVQSYDKRDTILYALGLGLGADPLDESELPFVYEKDLRCLPSWANVLCHPGFWAQDPAFGIDWVKILHAEQDYRIHQPLPATGAIRGEYAVAGIEDKGEGRGALLHQEKELFDVGTGDHLATVRSTLFLRGNGGEGSFGRTMTPAAAIPDKAPDRVVEIPTLPRQAFSTTAPAFLSPPAARLKPCATGMRPIRPC